MAGEDPAYERLDWWKFHIRLGDGPGDEAGNVPAGEASRNQAFGDLSTERRGPQCLVVP